MSVSVNTEPGNETLSESTCNPLPVLALRIRCRFDGAAPTATHAGEMWRGAIKNGLREQSADLLAALFEPERHRAPPGGGAGITNSQTPGLALCAHDPRAPSIAAASDPVEQWLDLTFFGAAAPLAAPVLYGLMAQAERGVGDRALHFSMEEVLVRAVDGLWSPWRLPARSADISPVAKLAAGPSVETDREAGYAELALVLTSRLRLVVNGALLTKPPPLPVLVEALVSRVNRLGIIWGDGPPVNATQSLELATAAGLAVEVTGNRARTVRRWVTSGRQQSRYPGGGLSGTLVYRLPGNAMSLLEPLLALGEWTQLGQQTTAGAGQYRLFLPER